MLKPTFHNITINFKRIWRGEVSTNLADLMYITGESGLDAAGTAYNALSIKSLDKSDIINRK